MKSIHIRAIHPDTLAALKRLARSHHRSLQAAQELSPLERIELVSAIQRLRVNKEISPIMEIRRTEISSPLDALLSLSHSLAILEARHGMSSEEFYAQYTAGMLGDDRDFVEWAGDYQHFQSLKMELERKLETVP